MTEWVYLNGDWCPQEEASINVGDRGFLFADAVYGRVGPLNRTLYDAFHPHTDRL